MYLHMIDSACLRRTLFLLLFTSTSAQGEEAVVRARLTADEAFKAFDLGQFEKAGQLLLSANVIAKSPTLALYAARALVAQNKLLEASEQYQQATTLPATGTGEKLESQRQSQREAHAEHEKLLSKTPKLAVIVQGIVPNEVTVFLDGLPMAAQQLGTTQAVNPGTRSIVAISGERRIVEEVTLLVGDTKSVVLRFAPRQDAPNVLHSGSSHRDSKSQVPTATTHHFTIAWGFLGLGALGLGTGAVAGLMAMARADNLRENGCDDRGHCYDDQASAIRSYQVLQTTSATGYIVGGLSLAAGGTLLLLAPRAQPSSDGRPVLSAWIAPNSLGVRGRF